MLSRIVKFFDDANGLEKILRFGQYASLMVSELPLPDPDSKIVWKQVQGHFALSRRFFRLLKWYGCFILAYQALQSDKAPAEKLLRVAKPSFLGLYMFFEMFTIVGQTNAMNVTTLEWAQFMQREALKFWLYAIVSSIFLSLYQLGAGGPKPTKPVAKGIAKKKSEKGDRKPNAPVQNEAQAAYSNIIVQLVIDCADVLIPAARVEWLFVEEVYVGLAGTLSSVLGGQAVWDRVQAQAASVTESAG